MRSPAIVEEEANGLRKIYQKILDSCNRPYAVWVLGILSFTESCIFIIPPEVLLLPMAYANRRRALFFAFVTTITSVLGAVAGYLLGSFLWEQIQPLVFNYIPSFAKHFDHVGQLYQENAVSALFVAAFTPIPFKVFTVVAGVYSTKVSILTLIVTSLVGRGARYGILAGIVYIFGPKAHEIIEKHFKMFTIFMAIAAVLLFVLLKLR